MVQLDPVPVPVPPPVQPKKVADDQFYIELVNLGFGITKPSGSLKIALDEFLKMYDRTTVNPGKVLRAIETFDSNFKPILFKMSPEFPTMEDHPFVQFLRDSNIGFSSRYLLSLWYHETIKAVIKTEDWQQIKNLSDHIGIERRKGTVEIAINDIILRDLQEKHLNEIGLSTGTPHSIFEETVKFLETVQSIWVNFFYRNGSVLIEWEDPKNPTVISASQFNVWFSYLSFSTPALFPDPTDLTKPLSPEKVHAKVRIPAAGANFKSYLERTYKIDPSSIKISTFTSSITLKTSSIGLLPADIKSVFDKFPSIILFSDDIQLSEIIPVFEKILQLDNNRIFLREATHKNTYESFKNFINLYGLESCQDMVASSTNSYQYTINDGWGSNSLLRTSGFLDMINGTEAEKAFCSIIVYCELRETGLFARKAATYFLIESIPFFSNFKTTIDTYLKKFVLESVNRKSEKDYDSFIDFDSIPELTELAISWIEKI